MECLYDSFLDISGGRYTLSRVISALCLSEFYPHKCKTRSSDTKGSAASVHLGSDQCPGNEPFYLNSISDGAKACYHGPLALMKGDEAGRRLPAERSRAGLDAREAFTPPQSGIQARSWSTHSSVWLKVFWNGALQKNTQTNVEKAGPVQRV